MANIRPATTGDLAGINTVYNHYVLTSAATFDVTPVSIEARREWFGHYAATGPHRVLVATGAQPHEIAGFATSSVFRERPAYAHSVETSVYLSPDAVGQGVGTALYEALFGVLAGEDVHRAYAGVALPNPVSVALHERFGFRKVAQFTEVGRKFGRWWDVAWFEKAL